MSSMGKSGRDDRREWTTMDVRDVVAMAGALIDEAMMTGEKKEPRTGRLRVAVEERVGGCDLTDLRTAT